MTIQDFLEIGEVRSGMLAYKRLKGKAQKGIEDAFLRSERPYLAISGGKDSIAMAYLVDEVATRINRDYVLWAHVSDASFPGTVEIIRDVAACLGRELVLSESVGAFEAYKNPEMKQFGKQGVFFSEIRKFAKDYDLAFVGVRAYESKRRMAAAKAHGMTYFSADMGDVTVCAPLTWFRLSDVAAVTVEYDTPIHPIYYKLPVGSYRTTLDGDTFIRLGYATAKDLIHKGSQEFIRVNYPEIYNKLRAADLVEDLP